MLTLSLKFWGKKSLFVHYAYRRVYCVVQVCAKHFFANMHMGMFVSIPYRICIDLYSFVGCCCQLFEKMSKKNLQRSPSVSLFTVFIFPRLICLSRDCTAHVCLSVTT